jgi:uncharacterized protein YbjT (DUF2867 family)
MNHPLLVTGGTGTLGRQVTPLLAAAGRELRVLSRRPHEPAPGIELVTGDLATNAGVDAAVDGVDAVLHLAGGPKGDDVATRNLAQAASRAGVKHLVMISVIGAERMPLGYFTAKLRAERAVRESGVPWTVLRAAQFHDLVLTIARGMARLPLLPVPREVRFQPVDAREVASRLVELSLGPPSGLVADLPGPRVSPMRELVAGYLEATGRRRLILPVRIPGRVGRAYRAGANLSDAEVRGSGTWEDFLAERLPERQVSVG